MDVYGKVYNIRVYRQMKENVQAPRLVIVAYLPNHTACDMLRLCIESIRRFTPEAHELWVVDNCSPPVFSAWLAQEPGINVIFNLDKPIPGRSLSQLFRFSHDPPYEGSYANAVALEIASKVVDPDTKVIMTLHMDTVACRGGWLTYLRGHLSDEVRCVGVRMDQVREKVIHVLGMMFDFTLFHPLKLTYQHNMPAYDAGDAVSIALIKAGYGVWACRNTLWQPELTSLISEDSPFRFLSVDRAFDDDDQVIFMHLGRGIRKSEGCEPGAKTSSEEWLRFGREVLLNCSSAGTGTESSIGEGAAGGN